MTEPGLPVPIEEQEDTFLRNLHWLFFRPRRFFEGITAPKKKAWLYLFALTFGISATINRISMSAWRGVSVPETWAAYWAIAIFGGLIGMLLAYYVSAWFYNVVLGWCGVRQENTDLVRMVLFASCQISALPTILSALVSTIAFSDPVAADLREARWVGWMMILAAVWSFVTIYVGTRTVFKAPKRRAAFWFLVLPTALLVLSIVATLWLASLGGLSAPEADVTSPREFSTSGMAFSYPGNWRITDSEPDPEVEAKAEIQGQGGFFVSIQILESTGDPEAIADNWAAKTEEFITDATPVEPFGAWGTLSGAGRAFEGQAEGDAGLDVACKVRLFVAPAADDRVVMILEMLPKAAADKLEPGLALIRRTFTLKR